MPLILRREKDAPLTIEEIDENFESLDRRLQNLEKHLEQLAPSPLTGKESNSYDDE